MGNREIKVNKDPIYHMANEVLGVYGDSRLLNLRVAHEYVDEKIFIQGLFRVQLKDEYHVENESPYINLCIFVKLSSPSPLIPLSLPLPENINPGEYTLVYQWLNSPIFERDGKWKTYLAQLVKAIQEMRDQIQASNGKPIDDVALFSDVL